MEAMRVFQDQQPSPRPKQRPGMKGLTPRKKVHQHLTTTPRPGKVCLESEVQASDSPELGICDEEPGTPADQSVGTDSQRDLVIQPADGGGPEPSAKESSEEAAPQNSDASEGDIVAQMHVIVCELQQGIAERDEKIAEQADALDNASEDAAALWARPLPPCPLPRTRLCCSIALACSTTPCH